MSEIVKPRLVLLQSVTNKKQFFYLVFMDLPDNTDAYPSPVEIKPSLSGTDLSFTTDQYELPSDYNGNTITYMLKPFMIISEDESIPNIKTITFNAKTTKKKGDTGGILAKQIWTIPSNLEVTKRDTPGNYVCKDRCFVIQSFTNTSTYFVGTLVDYPSDVVIGTNPHLMNSNELEIERVTGSNPYKTYLVLGPGPASYDASVNPPTATYAAIYVNGYNTHDHKGIFLFEETNLYATAWPTEEGTEVSSI
jgi:hypothetical protein